MIKIAVTREAADETRVAISPETVKKFVALGCDVAVETGAGNRSRFSDDDLKAVGARIVASAGDAISAADIVLSVNRPTGDKLSAMKDGAIAVAMMDPFGDRADLDAAAATGVTAFTMEFMPRITRAQSMDVLSSQANLAGYKAVVDAASMFEQAMPMMMTAAGTVPAARVFIMGVGVAGLQAIATARRLGAIVSATDVRPATKEQVASLGAKFVAVENDEFKQAQTAAGYAKPMSEAYQKEQAELVAKHITNQDIVITTALIPGRPAPRLITTTMVESMRPGAVIVDLAAERGGNCELTKAGDIIDHSGVRIAGPINLAGSIPVNASSLYAKNLLNFLQPFIDKDENALKIDWGGRTSSGHAAHQGGQGGAPQFDGARRRRRR